MTESQDPAVRYLIRLPQTYCVASPEALIAVAQAADELGFYGVSVQDHIIADAALSSCGDLHDCSGDDRTVYEALHTLAFVAARTEGVKLVTGILVVPFRHAVLLAKETAALDLFSGGRLVVGVGVGAPRRGRIGSGGAQNISVHARVADKEFSAFKVEGHRGKITDETLQVMDAIWTQGSATFHGKYYDFEELEVYPKPLQQPRPRLWIGGRSEAAQDRAVLLADGWIPSQISVPMFADGVTHMRALATEQGRPMPQDLGVNVFVALGDSDRQAREFLVQGFGSRFNDEGLETLVIYGTPETFAKKLQRFVDAGVNVFDLKLVPITVDATLEAMCLLAAEVFPAVSR